MGVFPGETDRGGSVISKARRYRDPGAEETESEWLQALIKEAIPAVGERLGVCAWDVTFEGVYVSDLQGGEYGKILELLYNKIISIGLRPDDRFDRQIIDGYVWLGNDLWGRSQLHQITWEDLAERFGPSQ